MGKPISQRVILKILEMLSDMAAEELITLVFEPSEAPFAQENDMKTSSNINNIELNDLLVPSFDHTEPEDDDCGLPENPIFSNYSKYLWKGQSEIRIIRENAKLRKLLDGHNHTK